MSPRASLRRWFFARQRPESGVVVLDRRRIYIVPSATGWLFGLVLTVMYVGAVNYNLGLGHALVFLLAGLGLVGMLHAYRNLVGLEISAGRAPPVFAGQPARFEIRLRDRENRPRPAIGLQVFSGVAALSGDSRNERSVDVPAGGGDATLELLQPAERRGWLALDRLRVGTCYPLGLFQAWSYPWPERRCLIYPAPEFTPLPPPRASERSSGTTPLASDEHDDFAGFRAHHPGDSPRHVAWKRHARDATDGPLLVKEFTGSGRATHWFDFDAAPPADTERKLSILCGWVLQAREADEEFGLILPDRALSPARGAAHTEQALEALALFGEGAPQ